MLVGPSLDLLGGMSVQAAQLVDQLRGEPTVEVTFVAINPRLPGALGRLQAIKYVRTVVTSAYYVAQLLTRVPRHDVVHVSSSSHTSFVIASTPPILIARLFRKAALLHYHSGDADIHLRRWRRTAARTMRLADAIVVPSRYLVEEFARHGLSTRLIVNWIEPARFRFRERRPLRPVFLTNRQLKPIFNVGCVLRAFALVQQQVRDARLIVAGDGSARRQLERLAGQLGLRQATFIGSVPPEQMPDFYSAADVFLNGADFDNAPLSILEAFAAGLPVVSTDVGGVPELVRAGETGMLVHRDDHAGMAACALGLLDDPELSTKLVRNAREECRRYVWPAVREQWLKVYVELSRRPRARRLS
jgi:glycosyltransferase involved in cell wall biosynthesis